MSKDPEHRSMHTVKLPTGKAKVLNTDVRCRLVPFARVRYRMTQHLGRAVRESVVTPWQGPTNSSRLFLILLPLAYRRTCWYANEHANQNIEPKAPTASWCGSRLMDGFNECLARLRRRDCQGLAELFRSTQELPAVAARQTPSLEQSDMDGWGSELASLVLATW